MTPEIVATIIFLLPKTQNEIWFSAKRGQREERREQNSCKLYRRRERDFSFRYNFVCTSWSSFHSFLFLSFSIQSSSPKSITLARPKGESFTGESVPLLPPVQSKYLTLKKKSVREEEEEEGKKEKDDPSKGREGKERKKKKRKEKKTKLQLEDSCTCD